MVRVVLLFLLMAASLQAQAPVWDAAARDAWWAEHPDPAGWRQAAGGKLAELVQSYQPTPAGELSPALAGWFNHLRWVSMVSAFDLTAAGLTV